MKKRILLILIMSMMIMGVVSASGINGDYYGNPIVKVKSNGKVLPIEDTPAIIYEGRTLVPIYMLKDLGAKVDWDQDTYSVSVSFPTPEPTKTPKVSFRKMTEDMKINGIESISYMSDGKNTNTISYHSTETYLVGQADVNRFFAILNNSLLTDALKTEITYSDGYVFSVPTNGIHEFNINRINAQQLFDLYRVDKPKNNASSNQATNNQSIQQVTNQTAATPQPTQAPVNSTEPTSLPTPTPTPTPTSTPAPIATPDPCSALRDEYTRDKSNLDPGIRVFPDRPTYVESMFEYTWNQRFAASGCSS